ncbi:nucleotide pyrophosphohydrolase [Arcobacter sp. CECT 8983]|uniref:nucleotide pyrophosphohydrolase n=1 Tax=Arcobacter sp. CECT 8983 TaxID=2044508 RepID=UPI00100BD7AD|nr:nucleotide pyrophosphohydrolase [Arcobacter sp. CECT 8983]RXJ91201.1 nucleotide pyrophosphohydrolase [Arcobacter sp. CECT 8983]
MNMEKIETIIKEFSTKRDWEKFHNPKNLSMALSVEASELVEIFQWLDLEQSQNLSSDKKEHAKEEIADIAVYLIRICMKLDINLEEAIIEKMKKNEKKYPLFDKDGNKIEYGKKK